jgi:diguanylate cyclase (GGDEF)-like protein
MGLFFGFMAAIGLSNFFFFITTRLNTFLVYSAYVLCLTLTMAALHGLGYKYLWPDSPWLQEHSVTIFANATVFFTVIFTDLLLDVKSHSPRLSLLLKVSAGLFLLCLLLSLFLPHALFITGFLVMLILVILLICSVGIWLWLKGVRLAKFYTLAWVALFLSGFVASLDNLNLIKLDISYHYLLMIGASIETSLLALVLALSYGQQRQDTFDAQEAALNTERQARATQQEMLDLQNSAKQELEYNVQERTLELQIALRELSETNRELEEKNTLDALTGIRNRRYFDKKYTAEIRRSRRERTELSVVMIDIDHFKKVNDEHGHLVGDECIKFVANTLQNALKRPSDDVCRYGGEEFALILPSTDLEGAHSLVERVRQYIQDTPLVEAELAISLSISAGIATAIAEPKQAEAALLAFADKQLYRAKNTGRNKVLAAQFIASPHNEQDKVDV